MLVLGIETATAQVGVAIANDDGVLASFHASGDRRHAETLVPAIQFVCAQAQVSLAQLDAVAVDVGPGLFTGLRVGLATAKAVAFGCDVPLLGVTSLAALAFSARLANRMILAAVDARRAEIFYATYRGTDDGIECVAEPKVGEPLAVVKQLALDQPDGQPAGQAAGLLAVGDGALRYGELFESVPGLVLGPTELRYPSATALVQLAHSQALREEFATPAEIVPLYLRAPDARINWEQRVRA